MTLNYNNVMKHPYLIRAACVAQAVVMAASCANDTAADTAAPAASARFSVETRAEGGTENPTYRFMAYQNNVYAFKDTGTYRLKTTDDEALTGCKLKEDGTFVDYDETAGLNSLAGSYTMVVVSPGVKNNDDGSFDFVPSKEAFVATAPKAYNIGYYYVVRIDNKLQDNRSRINVNFYKAESMNSEFKVTNARLIGAGAGGGKVRLYPASRQVDVSRTDSILLNLTKPIDGQTVTGKGTPVYTAENIYVASAIYTPKDEAATILKATDKSNLRDGGYIYLAFDFERNGRKVAMRIPLTTRENELKPQNIYTFNIIVSSDYLTATVDVFKPDGGRDWQDGDGGEAEIVNPTYTVKMGRWSIVNDEPNGWEPINPGEQEIKADKNENE